MCSSLHRLVLLWYVPEDKEEEEEEQWRQIPSEWCSTIDHDVSLHDHCCIPSSVTGIDFKGRRLMQLSTIHTMSFNCLKYYSNVAVPQRYAAMVMLCTWYYHIYQTLRRTSCLQWSETWTRDLQLHTTARHMCTAYNSLTHYKIKPNIAYTALHKAQ